MDSSNTLSSSPLAQAELDTQLLKAVLDGNTVTVLKLIAAGANVNAANQRGDTALMVAVLRGHTNIASVLIAAKADVNAANQYGYTALILAAANGRINIVSALITAGADVNAANRDGNTALTLATHEGHDETAFRLLNAMPPQEISPLINRLRQPAIARVEAAYHEALSEFRQRLTNMLSALNEGTGRHALGTTNALLHIIASYYAPDWCGRPSEEMNRVLIEGRA